MTPSKPRCPRLQPDRGSATVLVLALAFVLMFFGGFGLALGEVVVAHSRLGQLTDEAARAGAYAALAGADACAAAASFVGASPVRVTQCVSTDSVTVALEAPLPAFLRQWLPHTYLHATARAGA